VNLGSYEPVVHVNNLVYTNSIRDLRAMCSDAAPVAKCSWSRGSRLAGPLLRAWE
jgi:hypothetical protein